jgi:predicted phosphate transport protein (TIGR00153 family)
MVIEKSKSLSWFNRIFEPRIDFYALLNSHAQKVLDGMEALEQWFEAGAQERCQRVRDLENEADELKLELERKLVEAFVTPFDREDIYDLSARLDEVINSAKAVVREVEALHLDFDDSLLKEMVSTLVEGTRCLKQSFELLGKDLQEAANQATLARKSENRFSRIYRVAMRELFSLDDFKIVLKTREIYRSLLVASERIDTVGEKLLHVIVKIS